MSNGAVCEEAQIAAHPCLSLQVTALPPQFLPTALQERHRVWERRPKLPLSGTGPCPQREEIRDPEYWARMRENISVPAVDMIPQKKNQEMVLFFLYNFHMFFNMNTYSAQRIR